MSIPIKLSPIKRRSHSRGISLTSEKANKQKSINTNVLGNLLNNKSLLAEINSKL